MNAVNQGDAEAAEGLVADPENGVAADYESGGLPSSHPHLFYDPAGHHFGAEGVPNGGAEAAEEQEESYEGEVGEVVEEEGEEEGEEEMIVGPNGEVQEVAYGGAGFGAMGLEGMALE